MSSIDGYVVLGSFLVGSVVGATGAGGGALMTPMLTAVFGVHPAAAISSDLVSSVFMRPFGAAVHLKKGTVNFRLVRLLAIGSVPTALAGSVIFKYVSKGASGGHTLKELLGAVLLLGVGATLGKLVLDKSRAKAQAKEGVSGSLPHGSVLEGNVQGGAGAVINDARTVMVGAIVGLMVGITSVGSGSLTVVMLLLLYPSFRANDLVGTDIVQSVPLSMAASVGALIFGHVAIAVTVSLIIGSVPGVILGSLIGSHVPSHLVRLLVIMASTAAGVSYVGVPSPFILVAVGAAVVMYQFATYGVQT